LYLALDLPRPLHSRGAVPIGNDLAASLAELRLQQLQDVLVRLRVTPVEQHDPLPHPVLGTPRLRIGLVGRRLRPALGARLSALGSDEGWTASHRVSFPAESRGPRAESRPFPGLGSDLLEESLSLGIGLRIELTVEVEAKVPVLLEGAHVV